MTRAIFLCGSVSALAACSLSGASEGIGEAQALLSTTSAELAKTVDPQAEAQLKVAEDRLISLGEEVLVVRGSCDASVFRLDDPEAQALSACVLVSRASEAGTELGAFEVQQALFAMQEYWAALQALSTASTRERIDKATSTLNTRLAELLEALPGGDGSDIRGASAGVEALFGFTVDQVRTARLREIMARADGVIGRLTDGIIANIATLPGGEVEIVSAFRTAERELLAAEESGNAARYRKAVADLRKAHTALTTYTATSPADQLWLVRRAHADVLARLRNPTADDILTTLEEIKSIVTAIEGEDAT